MRLLIAIFLGLMAPSLFAAEPNVAGVDPLENAKREFRSGRMEAALAALDQIEKDGASTGLALDLRGCIYLEWEKPEEAGIAFRAAQEKDPSLYAPQLHLGDVFLRQRKWEEARAAYGTVIKRTNILILDERLRYAVLLTYLGAKDDAGGQAALERLVFPTESAAYYYGQAAWAYAQGNKKAGLKWTATADKIFDAQDTAWFARPLYDLGWIKTKPSPVLD